jgi:chromosomal replication initiator protein
MKTYASIEELRIRRAKKWNDKGKDRPIIFKGRPIYTIDYIQKIASDFFNMPLDKMKKKVREREIVRPRQVGMYFCKNYTSNSLADIGNAWGGFDHATVLNACTTVENLMDTEPKFKMEVEKLELSIKS